ncbi:MAG TPA: PAS domain S-box protein [Thermoanaerobaculia bacterium]|nr:PAS domain S-box protein [Thermoanaerobaculia bacterium]
MRLPLVNQVMSLVRKSGGASQRLALSRDDRVRLGLDQAPVGVAFVSPDGHWLYANDRFRAIVGYTREELSRISLHGITHPEDGKKELPLIKRLVNGEIDSYRLEKRVMSKTGRYGTLDVLTSVVRAEDGGVDFLIYIADEVHASRRHEPARDADRLLAHVIDQLSDVAIIRTDDHGVITAWNAGAQRIFGYTREEIVGKNRRQLYRDADGWDGNSTRLLKESGEGGRIEGEDWRVTKDGAHLWVRTSITPFRQDGTIKGFVETISPPAAAPKGIDTKPLIEQLRAEVDKGKRTEESLREALGDLRRMGEETMEELRIMTVALRKEIDRRKLAEEELARVSEQLAAIPPQPPAVEEVAEEEEEIVERPSVPQLALTDALALLRDLATAQRTGTLLVTRGDREKAVFFEEGRIFSCASNDPDKFLAQRLIASTTISEEQREKALEIKHASQLAIGRILLILGAISEEQLVDAMRAKLDDEIAELLTWSASDALCSFVDGDVPSLQLVPLRVEVEPLLTRLTAPPPVYVASKKGKKVHKETCLSAKRIRGASRVLVASTDGYERCRMCFSA